MDGMAGMGKGHEPFLQGTSHYHMAGLIFQGSPEEDDRGVSLQLQQLDLFGRDVTVGCSIHKQVFSA